MVDADSPSSDGGQPARNVEHGIIGDWWDRDHPILRSLNENTERFLIYVFYTYLIFIIVMTILRRFVLDFSSLWGSRTAVYAYLYLTYIGMSWATYKRAHIRLDVLFQYVSERVEGYLYILSDIVMFVFAVLAIRYTIPLIQTSLEFGAATQALRVNRAFFQIAIPIGFTLFIFRVLQRLYYDVRDVRSGRPVYKGESVFLEDDEEIEETGSTGPNPVSGGDE